MNQSSRKLFRTYLFILQWTIFFVTRTFSKMCQMRKWIKMSLLVQLLSGRDLPSKRLFIHPYDYDEIDRHEKQLVLNRPGNIGSPSDLLCYFKLSNRPEANFQGQPPAAEPSPLLFDASWCAEQYLCSWSNFFHSRPLDRTSSTPLSVDPAHIECWRPSDRWR